MKRYARIVRLALIAALSLCLAGTACAEELGEIDLYDPAIYARESAAAVQAPEDEVLAQAVDAPRELPEFDLPVGGQEAGIAEPEGVSAAFSEGAGVVAGARV